MIADYSAATLGGFVAANVATGSTVVSDGWSGYAKLRDVRHDPKVIGATAAHVVLPWIHRVFANAKRWALGVYHGLRRQHVRSYLDEFVFRAARAELPRRVRVPLHPPTLPVGRVRSAPRPQPHPPTRYLPDVDWQELKG